MCLAIPGQIVELVADPIMSVAIVDVLGVRRRVNTAMLADDPPAAGDWVLIHVGFAMSKISDAEARDQLAMLAQLGEADTALEEVSGYGLGDGDEPEERS